MATFYILRTSAIAQPLANSALEVLQYFGQERVVFEDKNKSFEENFDSAITGEIVLVKGEKEDFLNLLNEVGELIVSTSPFLPGGWELHQKS